MTNDLEGGDRQRAMKRLRVPPLGEQQSPWTTFKVGLFSGSLIVLLAAVVLSGNKNINIHLYNLYINVYVGLQLFFIIKPTIGEQSHDYTVAHSYWSSFYSSGV